MNEVTEWFEPEIKPVRKGMYQRNWECHHLTEQSDYFDGDDWYVIGGIDMMSPSINNLQWRGLANKP